jgi:hypothetical protein
VKSRYLHYNSCLFTSELIKTHLRASVRLGWRYTSIRHSSERLILIKNLFKVCLLVVTKNDYSKLCEGRKPFVILYRHSMLTVSCAFYVRMLLADEFIVFGLFYTCPTNPNLPTGWVRVLSYQLKLQSPEYTTCRLTLVRSVLITTPTCFSIETSYNQDSLLQA